MKLNDKRRKFELDRYMLERNADELCEKAEKESSKIAHDLIVKSNALRRDARLKKGEMCSFDAQIRDKEEHLKSL